MNENTETLIRTIVRAMQDKKADRIVSLDLTALDGAVCDAFVICQAESTTQVAAIAAGIEELTVKELQEKPWRVQGLDNALWVAMDYGNVMAHIFQSEMRDFYRLEELWADGELTRHDDQD